MHYVPSVKCRTDDIGCVYLVGRRARNFGVVDQNQFPIGRYLYALPWHIVRWQLARTLQEKASSATHLVDYGVGQVVGNLTAADITIDAHDGHGRRVAGAEHMRYLLNTQQWMCEKKSEGGRSDDGFLSWAHSRITNGRNNK
jgi:hypothetical protein